MAEGVFVVLVFGVALLAPLVLYVLIRAEHDQRETMDWDDAEAAARRDRNDGK